MNAMEISRLTAVAPNGKVIFRDLSLIIGKGEINVFIGGSGAGKSVFMKILSGLIRNGKDGWDIQGSIRVFGEETTDSPVYDISYIFQDYALFEDLNIWENLKIAHDHSPNQLNEEEYRFLQEKVNERLLNNIPKNVPLFHLSGGQKQRVAIARALFFNPKILLYDEPNAGLDAKSSAELAALVQEVGEKFSKTSLLILHHTSAFLPYADKVFLLNPVEKKVKEIKEIPSAEAIEDLIVSGRKDDGEKKKNGINILGRINKKADVLGDFVFDFLGFMKYFIFPWYPRFKWGARYLSRYFLLLGFSLSNLIYLALAGIITGFVATFFVFEFFPYKKILEPLLLEQVLSAIGFVLFRIAIPVIATILIAAKNGATIAADISSRVYKQQILAMDTLKIPYHRYLLTNIIWSFVINTPLLVMLVSYQFARLTSFLVFHFFKPQLSQFIWYQYFHSMTGEHFIFGECWYWVLAKSAVCGLLIALTAYRQGVKPKTSINDVNNSITMTIVLGTIFTLLTHFVFAFFEF